MSEAQYMISTVACGPRLQVITSYKNHASFLPFISCLIFPFAIPLKATLLTLTVISQVCLLQFNSTLSSFLSISWHSPDTSHPHSLQDTAALPVTSHASMKKSFRLFLWLLPYPITSWKFPEQLFYSLHPLSPVPWKLVSTPRGHFDLFALYSLVPQLHLIIFFSF